MRAFLDTSSLIKLYHLEVGSVELRAQLPDTIQVIVTQLTWVESTSSFTRIVRHGALSQADADEALQDLRADWPDFLVIPIDQAVYLAAAQLVQKHSALAPALARCHSASLRPCRRPARCLFHPR